MGVRDPLVDRSEHSDERSGPATSARTDLTADVPGLLEPQDPSPQGRRGKWASALFPRELGLPAPHVAEARRLPSRSRADGTDDAGLDRHPKRRSFQRPATRGLGERSEDLAPNEVDGASGAATVLDRAGHQASDHPAGRGPAQGTLQSVGHDRAESALVVGWQHHERAEPELTLDRALKGGESLRGPGYDRPERGEPALPFGQEPVGVSDRANHGRKVRAPDPHVVQDQDDGTRLPSDPTEESSEDLGDRKSPTVESFIQPLYERGGHPMRPAQSRHAKHDQAREGAIRARSQTVRDVPGRPAGYRGGSRPTRPGDPDDPGSGSTGPGWVEASDDLVHFAAATDDDGREPVPGENLGTHGGEHGLMYNMRL